MGGEALLRQVITNIKVLGNKAWIATYKWKCLLLAWTKDYLGGDKTPIESRNKLKEIYSIDFY